MTNEALTQRLADLIAAYDKSIKENIKFITGY